MDEYCKQRLMMYDARLIHVIDELECEIKCAREKAQVIEWIVQGVVKSDTRRSCSPWYDPERYLSLTYRQTTSKQLSDCIKKSKIWNRLRYQRLVRETSMVE